MADIGTSITTPAVVQAEAGTRKQFPAAGGTTTCKTIVVQALSTNTSPVVVGDKTVVAAAGTQASPTQVGIELKPGGTISLDLIDTAQLWLDTRTNKDGVAILILNA